MVGKSAEEHEEDEEEATAGAPPPPAGSMTAEAVAEIWPGVVLPLDSATATGAGIDTSAVVSLPSEGDTEEDKEEETEDSAVAG